jgi:hypothetical protein
MAGTISKTAGSYIAEMARVVGLIDPIAVERFAEIIFNAWRDDRHVFVFGNGGSAYTSSHFVTDLVKTASVEGKKRLHAISLLDNVGLTTAIGNDMAYEDIFRFTLENGVGPSHNDGRNVLRLRAKRQLEAVVIRQFEFGHEQVRSLFEARSGRTIRLGSHHLPAAQSEPCAQMCG